ncbi:hypothetical protein L9F63_018973, partial [Diploptera punctata]
ISLSIKLNLFSISFIFNNNVAKFSTYKGSTKLFPIYAIVELFPIYAIVQYLNISKRLSALDVSQKEGRPIKAMCLPFVIPNAIHSAIYGIAGNLTAPALKEFVVQMFSNFMRHFFFD